MLEGLVDWWRELVKPEQAGVWEEHFDYRALRLSVGLIGFVLPFALYLRASIFDHYPGLPSISSYYHSSGQDIFVGSLCIIAMFLLTYHGKATADRRVSTIGGIAALGIAFFPTAPLTNVSSVDEIVSMIHLFSAGVFFIVLAVFCLGLFPNAPRFMDANQRTIYEIRRDRIYRVCGWLIIFCMIAIVLTKIFPGDWVLKWRPVFYLEWLALVAFGASWITAGKYWRFSGIVGNAEAYGKPNRKIEVE
ncbi:MAG: hypothetical protein AAF541_05895 [Pseudomonadota bacterium]